MMIALVALVALVSSQSVEFLSHELYHVREAARRELLRRGEEALEELERASQSEDAETALAAVKLLVRIGEKALPALEKALLSDNDAVASLAWDAATALRGRAWIGVSIGELEGPNGEPVGGGVLVASVLKDTPAESSGMKPGDIIVGFDGQESPSVSDLIRLVGATRPGTRSRLELIRSGELMVIELTVARMPDMHLRR